MMNKYYEYSIYVQYLKIVASNTQKGDQSLEKKNIRHLIPSYIIYKCKIATDWYQTTYPNFCKINT